MKFNLKTLLLSIAFVAFVLFAMTNARHYWIKYYYAVTILILAISLTRVFVQHGAKRAFHIGFCIFGIGYLLIVFGPWKVSNRRIGNITNSVMNSLHPLFEREMSQEDAEAGGWIIPGMGITSYAQPYQIVPVDPSMIPQEINGEVLTAFNPTPPRLPLAVKNVSVPTQHLFRVMGSAVWALCLGLIGGIIGRLSYQETG